MILKTAASFFDDAAGFAVDTGTDLCGILDFLCVKRKYRTLSFPSAVLQGLIRGEELREAWRNAIDADSAINVLTEEEKETVLSVYECFDAPTKDELYLRLTSFSDIMESFAAEENERFKKNGSVWVGLSLLGAAALFIILV